MTQEDLLLLLWDHIFIDNPLTYLTYTSQPAALKTLLPNSAYANDFVLIVNVKTHFG
jgi:hypothetical protein